MINESILIKKQEKKFVKYYEEEGKQYKIDVTVSYDDRCGNRNNSFAITADLYKRDKNNKLVWESSGCLHELIVKHFPEFKKFVKWHLFDSDGPMNYLSNTMYFVGKKDFDAARTSALWPDATDEELSLPADELKAKLIERLPGLIGEFKKDVESLGFVF